MKKYLWVLLCGLAFGLLGCEKEDELEDNPNSIYYKLQADGRFTNFLTKINEAGLAPRLKSNEEFTVFAVADGTGTYDYDVRWHVVLGAYSEDGLVDVTELRSVNSRNIEVNSETYTILVEYSAIIELDIEAANGYAHVLSEPIYERVAVPVLPRKEDIGDFMNEATYFLADMADFKILATAAMTDEGISVNNPFALYDTHQQHGNGGIQNIYVDSYAALRDVYHAKQTLLQLRLTNEERQEYKAQLDVIDALIYLRMVQTWGDIIYLHVGDISNWDPIRHQMSLVLDSLVKLAEPSLAFLPASTQDIKQPDTWVGNAVLAEIYLYQQNWQGAATLLEPIVNSGRYTLPSPNAASFAKDNVLLGIELNGNSTANFDILMLSESANHYADSRLLSKYESTDLRLASWYNGATVLRYDEASIFPLISYSKILLMYAEALARQGNLNEAIEIVNIMRERANASVYNAGLSQNEVLDAVLLEYQLELAYQNERYNTLRRFGKFMEVMGNEENLTTKDLLFPIPSIEVQFGVRQNPGY